MGLAYINWMEEIGYTPEVKFFIKNIMIRVLLKTKTYHHEDEFTHKLPRN